MRKNTMLLLAMAVFLAAAPAAWAGVEGTAHDITPAPAQGVCSACHIPHKALGERLWPSGPGTAAFGVVGALCYSCHGTGGMSAAQANNTALHPNSHPLVDLDGVPATDVTGSGLPYPTATFECTSCHNPHSDINSTTSPGNQAFLNMLPNALCMACHQTRDSATNMTHPVGAAIVGELDGTPDSPINPSSFFQTAYSSAAGPGKHNLGGHSGGFLAADAGSDISGEGMGCVTCHAVHGYNVTDDGDATGALSPVESLLVPGFAMSGQSIGGQTVATGDGDAANFLCENCHGDGTPVPITTTGAPTNWNPGATAFSHPVDFQDGALGLTINTLQTLVPKGAGTSHTTVICESCHQMHPEADVPAYSGTKILRAGALCNACHGTASGIDDFPGHHPSREVCPTGYFCDTVDMDGITTNVGCVDCHDVANPSQGMAHNWNDGGDGLTAGDLSGNFTVSSAWLALSPSQQLDTTSVDADRNAADVSVACVQCHTLQGNPVATGAADPTSGVQADFQNHGLGTHYIGPPGGQGPGIDYAAGVNPTDTVTATGGRSPGTPWNATTGTWPGGGWSRFAGGTGDTDRPVVCESCHELEPDKNVAGTDLLLQGGGENWSEDRSKLCEGCHGANPVTGKTHPQTNQTIGKTDAPLDTDGTAGIAVPNPTWGTYPGADQMNCDSCHQVHKAGAGILILEAPEADTGTPTWNSGTSKYEGIDTVTLCADCHPVYK